MLGLGLLPAEQENIHCKVKVVQIDCGWNIYQSYSQHSSFHHTSYFICTDDLNTGFNLIKYSQDINNLLIKCLAQEF